MSETDQKLHKDEKDELEAYIRRLRLRLQELRYQRSLRHKPNN